MKEMLGTTYLKTEHHIPKDLNLQRQLGLRVSTGDQMEEG
jgi:hypothetical protein